MVVGHTMRTDGVVYTRCVHPNTGQPLIYDIDVGISRYFNSKIKRVVGSSMLEIAYHPNGSFDQTRLITEPDESHSGSFLHSQIFSSSVMSAAFLYNFLF